MEPKKGESTAHGFMSALGSGAMAASGAAAISDQARISAARRLAFKMRSQAPHADPGARATGRLLGRKALIAGGITGIGHAVAQAFAREGADVAVNYLPTEQAAAESLLRQIRQDGRKALPQPGELVDEEFCNRLVAHAAHGLGGLDILVTVAAHRHSMSDIAAMSTEQFDASFRSNIYAMFWLTRAALPHMGPGSSVINTTSIESPNQADLLLDYSATKGAIMVFTKSLARQLASRGIRVNAVSPAPIWTPRP
ncbi:MAG: SDR family NAD(P)-dependent oxidoreductase, partial [Steroidobacteraceae bacterium]